MSELENSNSTENKETENLNGQQKEQDSPYFFLLYKNENEDYIRNLSVNLQSLLDQAKAENLTDQQINLVMYGFESAFRVMMNNYNVSQRQIPIDAFGMHETYLEKINESLEKEEKEVE